MNSPKMPAIGVLTISDRAFRGVYEDKGGPEVRRWLEPRIPSSPPSAPRQPSENMCLNKCESSLFNNIKKHCFNHQKYKRTHQKLNTEKG